MFGIGTQELVVILLIVLVLFGGRKLPELSRGLGEAIREIRKGFQGDTTVASKDKSGEPKEV